MRNVLTGLLSPNFFIPSCAECDLSLIREGQVITTQFFDYAIDPFEALEISTAVDDSFGSQMVERYSVLVDILSNLKSELGHKLFHVLLPCLSMVEIVCFRLRVGCSPRTPLETLPTDRRITFSAADVPCTTFCWRECSH